MLTRIESDPGRRYRPAVDDQVQGAHSKRLYFDLSSRHLTERVLADARGYLDMQLRAAEREQTDMPDDAEQLAAWVRGNAESVGMQYSDYLAQRKAGAARRYFSNKSHALNFLQSVAPTKLVDGSWLYGLTRYWQDDRYAALIKIYLEELGEGLPEKNHVVLYRKLLATHGCEQWPLLSDDHFVQGAIQLSLAQHAAHYLPEIIGFNLGYEQLPLHLLITAYELNELDIDPYYFTLHITVDNASTGHAHKAVEGLLEMLPHLAGREDFYRRVVNGYKLNMLGAGTNSVIAAFDLDEEIIKVLHAKSAVGKRMHSDFCRIGGRTVNEWLAAPGQIPLFLDSMQQHGWIKRHEHPQHSRFWRLLEGDRAEMFGVFNPYERQVIYDWIAGDMSQRPNRATDDAGNVPSRQLSFRARQRLMRTLEPELANPADVHSGHDDIDADIAALEQRLAQPQSREDMMALLIGLISPTNHHTPCGLMATRYFSWMLEKQAHAA